MYNANTKNEAKSIEYLQNFFYSLEWGDIEAFLFTENCTEFDKVERDAFLENNKDLSQLSDAELRTAFQKLSPRSDWDRFFCDKIDTPNIKDIITQIRLCRNIIAHCKRFTKSEYDKNNKIVNRLNSDILKAIQITEDKDFAEKNSETLAGTLNMLSAGFASYLKSMAEIAQQTMAAIASSGLVEIGRAITESSVLKKLGAFVVSEEAKQARAVLDSISENVKMVRGLIPPHITETQQQLKSILPQNPLADLDLPKPNTLGLDMIKPFDLPKPEINDDDILSDTDDNTQESEDDNDA